MTRLLQPSSAIALLLLGALAIPADAQALRLAPRDTGPVNMTLIDRDSGDLLPAYPHRGTQWVAGNPGSPYAIRLTNTTNARVLVVLSVDGINAVTGDTADPSQAGYVLAPWQTTEIAGWRKSHENVARFVFTDLPDSYAARTGRPDNVGTVGIAVFAEQAVPAPRPMPPAPIAQARKQRAPAQHAESASMSSADRAPAMAEPEAQAQRIGTGHGAQEWAPVASTQFTRATRQPAQVLTLRYDAPAVLAAMGLPVGRVWQAASPQAFPGHFVADPPRGY